MNYPRKVYAIQHNKTKRMYIGSTENPDARYMNHLWKLRHKKHAVGDMQTDYDTYGEDYSFYILDEIKGMHEDIKEFEWMRKYHTYIRGIGYNYRDIEARRASIPYKKGLPTPFEKDDVRISLINEIVAEVEGCDDLAELDLCLRILRKAQER